MTSRALKQKHLLVLPIGLLLALTFQNCALKGMKSLSQNSSDALTPANYKPTNLTKAIVSAAKTFVNRLPTPDELTRAAKDVEGYKAVIAIYLNGNEFRDAMFREHQNYFQIGGPGTGDIDYDQPARLGAYLISTNLDYSGIVKANYCVGTDYAKQAFCDSFTSAGQADANAAGVLTMRAYIATHKPKKAFNFRLVSDSFAKFNCSSYPDTGNLNPMPNAEISSKIHPWGSAENNCYGCHKSINPKAYVFYSYGTDGRYTTTTGSTTITDANRPSTLDDVIVGSNPRVNNVPVRTGRDLGAILADDPRFDICMAQRYVNFMLGKSYDAALPSTMGYLAAVFRDSSRNVRQLLLNIATSAAYVNRGEILQTEGSK